MDKVPYTPNPATIKKFFEAIQDLGTPPKVNQKYLPTIGFKSSNDRYLIGIIKFLGFIDQMNVPTVKWNEYKNKGKATQLMTSTIKSAYKDLFETYPDAEKRDKSTISNFFASKFGASASTSALMEYTFRQLCGLADFGIAEVVEPEEKVTTIRKKEAIITQVGPVPVTINVNIQLQLPATEDAAIYDSLFTALKKHLLS
jgi:hypothetical protein